MAKSHLDANWKNALLQALLASLLLLPTFFWAGNANAAVTHTIWTSTTVPATVDNGPDGPLELGVAFKSDTAGTITGNSVL